MVITFERDPWGWSHPFHRRRVVMRSTGGDWDDDFMMEPSLRTTTLDDFFNRSPSTTRSTRTVRSCSEGGGDREKFEMKVDVQQFTPSELDVKLLDNVLVVTGKQKDKNDGHGSVCRHLKRKFELPSDIKLDTIMCDLTPEGVLVISAKRIIPEAERKEMEEEEEKGKRIPILRSGPSRTYQEWKRGGRD